jgi:Rieske Fe-S protein
LKREKTGDVVSPETLGSDGRCGQAAGRRLLLQGLLLQAGLVAATSAAVGRSARADDDDPARSRKPQIGDQFVFYWGDREGKVITPADLPPGGPFELAWPMDPKSGKPRDGSRLNQVILIKLDPDSYAQDERPLLAEGGIAAFSAICTHQQCTVSEWTDKGQFHCVCHNSEYDPRQAAKVTFGPAPRALPGLPVKIVDGALVVAGPFNARVGGESSA